MSSTSRSAEDQPGVGGWRPWVVWIAGTLAFAAAMFSRTSFGVAGMDAAERFGTPVALLSTFVVVQMIVYGSMQIPAGLLLDRFGSRATIAAGALIMGTGQVILALATSFPLGLAARALIGGGDSLIWMSTMRLIPIWFAPRHVSLLTQISSVAGQLGQWASAVPLVRILGSYGWTPAFLTVAGAVLLGGLLNVIFVRDAPQGVAPVRTLIGSAGLWAAIREVIRMPAGQLSFWMHMATAFPALVFTLMWGFPYLTQGQGRSPEQAGSLMTVMVVAGVIIGPLMGVLTRRLFHNRVGLAVSVVGATIVVWVLLLLWPGTAPGWLLVLLMIIVAADFPASNIGFDINRTFIPARRLGTASGLAVVGGFIAAVVDVLIISVVLSAVGGANPGPEAFRLAMATQLPIWAFALFMVWLTRRKLMAAEGIDRV